jgi:hypothetical protein
VLRAIRKIVELALGSRGRLTADDLLVLNSLPLDERTVFKIFNIEDDTTSYICCPKCFRCYSFDPDDPESYPIRCTNERTATSGLCNRTLRKTSTIKGREYSRPVWTFVYHDMKKWVKKFVSRPGLEDILDRKYSPSLAPDPAPDGFCDDILGSPGIRNFLGPDQKTPFLEGPGNLIFSLAMDGFNPYGKFPSGPCTWSVSIYPLSSDIDSKTSTSSALSLGLQNRLWTKSIIC